MTREENNKQRKARSCRAAGSEGPTGLAAAVAGSDGSAGSNGPAELAAAVCGSDNSGKLAAKATVFIPVRSLKSGKKRMDEVMHAAMNAKKHSKIEFTLSEITVKAAKGTLSQCDSKGTLKINGKIRPISI